MLLVAHLIASSHHKFAYFTCSSENRWTELASQPAISNRSNESNGSNGSNRYNRSNRYSRCNRSSATQTTDTQTQRERASLLRTQLSISSLQLDGGEQKNVVSGLEFVLEWIRDESFMWTRTQTYSVHLHSDGISGKDHRHQLPMNGNDEYLSYSFLCATNKFSVAAFTLLLLLLRPMTQSQPNKQRAGHYRLAAF